MMKKILFGILLMLINFTAYPQRMMEDLGRGLVAVKTTEGVFVSWRILGTEWFDAKYNIYRDGNKLNEIPLEISNFTDLAGTGTSNYTVTAIINNTEQTPCEAVSPLTNQYKEITLKERDTSLYEINDGTAADLDGDGEYEIIIKRICKGWNEDNTNYTYFEAYKQDGTFLWEINVGPNILPDVEINIAAFDFDEDGKAEVFLRTSEGTIFGDGTEIGDVDGDGKTNYRYSVGTAANMQYMNEGPEFLSLVDGLTGIELDRVEYIPRGKSSDWGDNYGHRATKNFFGAPYLDGIKPSLFIGRGIYTKTIMRAYDVVNKKLVQRWEFNSGNSGPYYGQGNHNYTIADVDGDGRDEIVWGSMTVDDDGQGLYSTNLGHGDALHVGDLDPFHKGIEIFKCLENSPVWGTVFYDGATGEIFLHHLTTYDCGRCMAGNISDDIKGCALWGGSVMYSASTRKVVGTGGGPENYRIYWDGDLLEEMTDHSGWAANPGYGTGAIYKYGSSGPILLANGATSLNYTKGTPVLQADLFGDWREEVIWRTTDNTKIRIYTTIDPTPYRIYTLMHDAQYRQAICWQMIGYNQPPHTSFFLGEAEGKTVPPPPGMSNNKLIYTGLGNWGNNSEIWRKNGSLSSETNGEQLLFDVSGGTDVSLELTATVTPELLTVNSPGNYTISAANGKLSGPMKLIKQGTGALTLDGIHDYSGKTEVWAGKLNFNGELTNSEVLLEFFGEMNASGLLKKGATLRYGSKLSINENEPGKLIIDGDLKIEEGAILNMNISTSDVNQTDSLTVNGNLDLAENSIFNIDWKPGANAQKVTPGEYQLIALTGIITGDLSKINISGLAGQSYELLEKDGAIVLKINELRQSGTIIWNGTESSLVWDLAKTSNFMNGSSADLFVTGDNVIFNDIAASKTITIQGEVAPASVWFNASSDYILNGPGKIVGNTVFKKSGTGKLTITNINDFTGKVIVNEGILETTSLPDEQTNGGIGVASNDPANLELNGGTISIPGNGNVNRALLVGANNGTLDLDGKLYWHEKITGETLIKTGTGTLLLGGLNTHQKTILKKGTLSMFNDDSNPGKTIVIDGGIMQFYNDMYSYSTIPCNIECAEGNSGILNMDSRAYYTGSLKGAGKLTINIPNVRTEFKGNWSAFEGQLNFVSTYSNSSGYPADVRLNNSFGFGKASVNLGANTSAYNLANTAFSFGELTGTGTLSGNNGWVIGDKNTNAVFDGLISAGNLVKTGSGSLTLTNSNTYSGGTTVEKGKLILSNTSGSATGSGNVTIKQGATLAGNGSMNGNLIVESSAAVSPGINSTGKLNIGKAITLNKNAYFSADVDPVTEECDLLISGKSVQVSGFLYLTKTGTGSFKAGNKFKLLQAPVISGSFDMIIPASPGDGLQWDTSELNANGILKVAISTGMKETGMGDLKIYPIPVQDYLYVELPDSDNELDLSVFNVIGEKKYYSHEKNSRLKLDLSGLSSGIYFLKIIQGEKTFVRKIMKQE